MLKVDIDQEIHSTGLIIQENS